MNMLSTIVPKSDQLNADDLIGRDMTIRITDVKIRAGQEQPVSISFEGDGGKPYKPCKSMCRVMVAAWGPDAANYKGRSMTLRRDPTVTWAGLEVGGIRISHMSDIDSAMTMALTMTKAKKKPFTVKPLATPTAPAQDKREGAPPVAATPAAGAATTDAPQASPSVATADSSLDDAVVPTDASTPTDSELVADIEAWVKKRKFDMAYDLCRAIKDEVFRDATKARIDKAKSFVDARQQSESA